MPALPWQLHAVLDRRSRGSCGLGRTHAEPRRVEGPRPRPASTGRGISGRQSDHRSPTSTTLRRARSCWARSPHTRDMDAESLVRLTIYDDIACAVPHCSSSNPAIPQHGVAMVLDACSSVEPESSRCRASRGLSDSRGGCAASRGMGGSPCPDNKEALPCLNSPLHPRSSTRRRRTCGNRQVVAHRDRVPVPRRRAPTRRHHQRHLHRRGRSIPPLRRSSRAGAHPRNRRVPAHRDPR